MKVTVERAEGHKCPRCWKYHGIPENYQGICDFCARALLEADPEDYLGNKDKEQTDEDFIAGFKNLQNAIREAVRSQYEKYAAK
jgi:phage FluMu protein Com